MSKKPDLQSKKSVAKDPKAASKTKGFEPQATAIPAKDRPNPFLGETFEPINSRM
jgi:hypothetical protein